MTEAKLQSFDLEWLTLREPVDHAAQNANVLGGVLRYFALAKTLDIIDLGAGTGSCLRKLAPLLAQDQRWRLVDGDASLLGVASQLCASACSRLTGRLVSVSTKAENLHQSAHVPDAEWMPSKRCADLVDMALVAFLFCVRPASTPLTACRWNVCAKVCRC